MRALRFALTAVGSGLMAVGGFAVAELLDPFAPCRVTYRVSNDVYGSLACQIYYAIRLFSVAMVLAACGLLAIAGILFFVRRSWRS